MPRHDLHEHLWPEPLIAALDAFNAGILELGDPFALWGAVSLARPRPAAVDALLDSGAIGISGPAPWTQLAGEPAAPGWWPALTHYVADMNQAWHAFVAWGRTTHPSLRVVWTMLAGGAPLQSERLASRGGPAGALHDPLAFYDVTSAGPRTLDAAIRSLGAAVAHAMLERNPQRVLGAVAVAA